MAKGKDTSGDVDAVAVGRRLRLARDALQLTQKDFAGQAGIAWTTLSNYETGLRLIPPGAALALCRSWGLSLDYIYAGELGNMQYALASAIKALMALERDRAPPPKSKSRAGRL